MSREHGDPSPVIYHAEHLLDRAAMLAMRAMIASQPTADLGPSGRASFDELMEKTPPADGVTYEAATVGGVSGWWCRPANANPAAAILYLHGGAYVVGSASSYRHFAGQIAASADAATFVAEYALAPEKQFPAAFEDAEAALRGLIEIGARRVAIIGDSAGGGLALSTAAQVSDPTRHRPAVQLAAVAAMSPWTDLALTGNSFTARAKHDPLLTVEALENARQLYLGGADPRDPRVSPLYGIHADLPPTLIHVGEDEILLDDARLYAERRQSAGSPMELHVWEGMLHVFPANVPLLRAAREATDGIGDFLRHHLAH